MKIYFAGPLFTEYEREFISKSAEILREHGIDPFVPHENTFTEEPNETRSRAKICLDKDYFGINGANAILAIVNGTEVDDGTACEIGIFHSLMKTDPTKKGIVALHGDWRTKPDGEGKELNAFVKGCIEDAGVICTSLQDAIAQLDDWKKQLVDEGYLTERTDKS